MPLPDCRQQRWAFKSSGPGVPKNLMGELTWGQREKGQHAGKHTFIQKHVKKRKENFCEPKLWHSQWSSGNTIYHSFCHFIDVTHFAVLWSYLSIRHRSGLIDDYQRSWIWATCNCWVIVWKYSKSTNSFCKDRDEELTNDFHAELHMHKQDEGLNKIHHLYTHSCSFTTVKQQEIKVLTL